MTTSRPLCLLAALLWLSALAILPAQQSERPNIIFILADDVGAESMDLYGGSSWPTPRINSIATAGMLFRNAYSAPSCAPTRAQFLTGRYPFRNGVTYPTLPNGPLSVTDETTFASILKKHGYATGLAGKWNVFHGGLPSDGDAEAQARHIAAHGFQESSAFLGHTIDYGSPAPEEDFVPFQLNQWACDFVQRQSAASKPFFLQYSLGLVHWALGGGLAATPLNPNATAQNTSQEDLYRAMMTYMDQMVGKLLDTLEEADIADNTVVVFAGDNGTWASITSTWNGRPVQGGKLTRKDTGSWVPLYVRWPGVVESGSTYEGMTDFSDLFPTFLEMAGAVVPNYRVIDGISFLPQLKGEEGEHREMIYAGQLWGSANNPLDRRFEFVRDKRHKLVVDGASEWLYDVSRSPLTERLITVTNQTPQQQEVRTKLRNYLRKLHATELSETGADSDRDGATDFEEVIAGTDPTSSRSKLAIARLGLNADGGNRTCTLRFPTVAGRIYRIQSSSTLESDGWTNVAGPISGTGGEAELTAPADEQARFYRLATERR